MAPNVAKSILVQTPKCGRYKVPPMKPRVFSMQAMDHLVRWITYKDGDVSIANSLFTKRYLQFVFYHVLSPCPLDTDPFFCYIRMSTDNWFNPHVHRSNSWFPSIQLIFEPNPTFYWLIGGIQHRSTTASTSQLPIFLLLKTIFSYLFILQPPFLHLAGGVGQGLWQVGIWDPTMVKFKPLLMVPLCSTASARSSPNPSYKLAINLHV